MKNQVAIVYLGIVLAALLLFALFDRNVTYQDEKASDSIRMSRINMLNAECGENIRLCSLAQSAGKGTQVSVKAVKIFIKYAEKNLSFGSEAGTQWSGFLESARSGGFLTAVADIIMLKKDEVENNAAVFAGLKGLLEKSIESGYNFEF